MPPALDPSATTFGWITAPPDALPSDFDYIIDMHRFNGTTHTAMDNLLYRLLFRQDMDGWVVIPGPREAPNSYKVVKLADIPAVRTVMCPTPAPDLSSFSLPKEERCLKYTMYKNHQRTR